MPVQQQVATVQPDTSWSKAIVQISDIASQATQGYLESKKRQGHNDRLYAQAIDTISDIKKRDNISDEDYAKLLKQIQPGEPDDENYDKTVATKLAPLALWSYSGASKVGVPLPDLNADPSISMQAIKAATDKIETDTSAVSQAQSAVGQPAQSAPQGITQVPKSFQPQESLFSAVAAGGSAPKESPVAPPVQKAVDTVTTPMNTSRMDPAIANMVNSPSAFSGVPTGRESTPQPTQSTPTPLPVSTEPQNASANDPSWIASLHEDHKATGRIIVSEINAQLARAKPDSKVLNDLISQKNKLMSSDTEHKDRLTERGLINTGEMARVNAEITSKEKEGGLDRASKERIANSKKTGEQMTSETINKIKDDLLSNPTVRPTLELFSKGLMSDSEAMRMVGGGMSSKGNAREVRFAVYAAAQELNPTKYNDDGSFAGGFNPKQFNLARGAEGAATRHTAMLQDTKVTTANSAMVLINHVIDPKTEKIKDMKSITPQFASELALNAARLVSPTGQVGIELQREFKQGTANENISKALAYFGLSSAGTTELNLRNIKAFIKREGELAEKTRNMDYSGSGAGVGFDSPELTNSGREASIPNVIDAASYSKIPSGSQYYDPQGNLRTKP